MPDDYGVPYDVPFSVPDEISTDGVPYDVPFEVGSEASSGTGSTSSAYGWTGSSAGYRNSDGDGSGSYSWSGSAEGTKQPEAHASGVYSWAGSATGDQPGTVEVQVLALNVSTGAAPGSFSLPRLDDQQAVSLHTYDGIQLYQFRPENLLSLSWSRDLRDTSRCELTAPTNPDFEPSVDILPWVHWVSVWSADGTSLLWTGPVQQVTVTRSAMLISSRDVSAWMSRTRAPLTKKWDSADPSRIAGEVWAMMIERQGLHLNPIERIDPDGDNFAYGVKADEKMVEDVIKELVGLGLRWTVVSGTPILGPMPKEPVESLSENDFLDEGIGLKVDGTATANDVLLRGGDALSRAYVPLAGLDLQTIVNVDDMFGVSNVDRATYQYARHTAKTRYSLALPAGATLHPEAPVLLEQLIPSSRFVIEAYGKRFLMELDSVDVTHSPDNATVQVTMESVNDDLPELIKLTSGAPPGRSGD